MNFYDVEKKEGEEKEKKRGEYEHEDEGEAEGEGGRREKEGRRTKEALPTYLPTHPLTCDFSAASSFTPRVLIIYRQIRLSLGLYMYVSMYAVRCGPKAGEWGARPGEGGGEEMSIPGQEWRRKEEGMNGMV